MNNTATKKLTPGFNAAAVMRQVAYGPDALGADSLQMLQRDAAAAQIELDAFGQKLALFLTGDEDNLRPRPAPKSDDRIREKTAEKYLGDYGHNCDLAAITIPLSAAGPARRALDLFTPQGPDHVVEVDGMRVKVVEFENFFTTYNPLKRGLPNATAIVEIETPTERGNIAHRCEIQFVPQQAMADLQASHTAYRAFRSASVVAQQIEEAILNAHSRPCLLALARERAEARKTADEHGKARKAYNEAAAAKTPWLQELVGYIPGNASAEKLENSRPKGISDAVMPMVA